MRRVYIATVQLVIKAEDEALACDTISGILSPYEMAEGTLVDWGYVRIGGQHLSPTLTTIEDWDEGYQEGDFQFIWR